MGINRAQAAAIADGFLDSVGEGRAAGSGAMPILDQVLTALALQFIDSANSNLDAADAVATGELSKQLTFFVEQMGTVYELSVGYPPGSEAAKYFDFVDQGVQGTEGSGRAPGSPYKFKTPFASKAMATAILKWYRQQGKGASNVRTPQNGLERKRVSLRDTISAADSLKAMAYATAVNIKKKGREATHFFSDAVETTFTGNAIDVVSEALKGEVRLSIRQLNGELKRIR